MNNAQKFITVIFACVVSVVLSLLGFIFYVMISLLLN
jgi:hypothetical protein